MATTNAALVQANNALKKLNAGANAQVAANAGQNVSQNLSKMNTSYTAAANGFRGVARKTNNIGLKAVSNSFNAAANAAEAAAAAKVDVKGLTKAIRDPALKQFEERKTKALAAAKKPAVQDSAKGEEKGVCRYCGCTMNTHCIGKNGETCAWLKGSGQTVCTNGGCLAKNKKALETARKAAAAK